MKRGNGGNNPLKQYVDDFMPLCSTGVTVAVAVTVF